MNILCDLHSHARSTPIRPANRIKSVVKLANDDLRVTQYSGAEFDISKDDELFQAFLIYTVLAEI